MHIRSETLISATIANTKGRTSIIVFIVRMLIGIWRNLFWKMWSTIYFHISTRQTGKYN